MKTEPRPPCLAFDWQMREREPELVFLPPPQMAPEGEVLSGVVPVFGQSFCQCDQQQEVTPGLGPCSECFCGEDDQGENMLLKLGRPILGSVGSVFSKLHLLF